MAILPNPGERQRVSVQPSMHVVEERGAGLEGRGIAQMGQGLQHFGAAVSKMAQKQQDDLDRSTADAAIAQYDQERVKLTSAPAADGQVGGFATQRSNAVLGKVEDKPFIDFYSGKLKDIGETVGATLSGNARKYFDAHRTKAETATLSGLYTHVATESVHAQDQNLKLLVESQASLAKADYANTNSVVLAMGKASDAAIQHASQQLGIPLDTEDPDHKAALELAAKQATSKVAGGAVQGAVEAGDPNTALELFNQTRSHMTDEDEFKAKQVVDKAVVDKVAGDAAHSVLKEITPALMPTDRDRALHSVAPEKRDEFAKILRANGSDIQTAWAVVATDEKTVARAKKDFEQISASNARADALVRAGGQDMRPEEVKKQRPSSWLDLLPKEAQKYVRDTRASYESGASAPEPTDMEIRSRVERKVELLSQQFPGMDVNRAKEAAIRGIASGVADAKQSQNQMRDQVLLGVQQQVLRGEVNSLDDLSPQQRAAIGVDLHKVQSYINSQHDTTDKIAEASPAATDSYYKLLNSPDMLKSTNTAALMSLSSDIGRKRTNDLIQRRAEILADPDKFAKAQVDADLFKNTIAPFMAGTTGKARQQREIAIRDAAEQKIASLRAAGQPVDDKRKREVIRELAMKYPTEKQHSIFGFGFTSTEDKVGATLPGGVPAALPPSVDKEMIDDAAKNGIVLRTPQDRVNYYQYLQEAKAAANQ